MQGKKKQKIEKVTKPYLRGRIVDRTLPGGALKFFFFTALMTFVYFMSLIVASVESRFLSVVINLAILGTTWLIFWQSGLASGAKKAVPWRTGRRKCATILSRAW